MMLKGNAEYFNNSLILILNDSSILYKFIKISVKIIDIIIESDPIPIQFMIFSYL